MNKIEGRQEDNGTSLHCNELPGAVISTVNYASFIITLFFDLSLFHMQPGIIAGDEVKYNRGYIMSLSQFKFSSVGLNILTDFAMLSRAVVTLLVMGCLNNAALYIHTVTSLSA